jgi:1-hydroxycarotenoid 3,4-desaturase
VSEREAVVIGAGIGGLCAAIELAVRGRGVTVVEQSAAVGGKMRTLEVDGRPIDAGPTVLTMREVFDGLFERAGARLDDALTLRRLEVLARHAWPDGARLDLHADPERSAEAIGELAGAREAAGFRRFCAHTRRIYETVEGPFIHGEISGLADMIQQLGPAHLLRMAAVDWHRGMWRALGGFFRDPRLRQLFGRYATYYGSSPFEAPATLSLIAHVEQRGVWAVEGGMIRLALALAELLRSLGGELRLGAAVEEVLVEGGRAVGVRLRGGETLRARAVVLNAAPEALVQGLLGEAVRGAVALGRAPRSLSAITWALVGRVRGFPLAYHTVAFSSDYRREFEELRAGRVPTEPTVYVCAQDRDPAEASPRLDPGSQRLFCLINAPARGGDAEFLGGPEIERCKERCWQQLRRCGLTVEEVNPTRTIATGPHGFAQMFPGTGGALYGTATHGLRATFSRPGSRTRLPGLYLVGGGVHPGAGVPMVAIGGRSAARSVHEDLASTPRFHPAGTSGGTSTASASTAAKP